jgi:hypothetical protein
VSETGFEWCQEQSPVSFFFWHYVTKLLIALHYQTPPKKAQKSSKNLPKTLKKTTKMLTKLSKCTKNAQITAKRCAISSHKIKKATDGSLLTPCPLPNTFSTNIPKSPKKSSKNTKMLQKSSKMLQKRSNNRQKKRNFQPLTVRC